MNILALISELLRVLASVPASSSFLTPHLDTILSAVASLIDAGEAGASELQALTAHIKSMAASGTDPTADDWMVLKARSDAAHTIIQAGTHPLPVGDTITQPPVNPSS